MGRTFLKSNFKVLKFFDKRDIGSIPRILISSIFVILFFYSMPLVINSLNNGNFEFQNNSKAILAYTLENKGNNIENQDQILNEKELLVDVSSNIEKVKKGS